MVLVYQLCWYIFTYNVMTGVLCFVVSADRYNEVLFTASVYWLNGLHLLQFMLSVVSITTHSLMNEWINECTHSPIHFHSLTHSPSHPLSQFTTSLNSGRSFFRRSDRAINEKGHCPHSCFHLVVIFAVSMHDGSQWHYFLARVCCKSSVDIVDNTVQKSHQPPC